MESQSNRSAILTPACGQASGCEGPDLESALLFRAVSEQSEDGILLIDVRTFRFVEFNEASCEALGYSREEFGRLALMDLQVGCDEEYVRRKVAEIRSAGRLVFDHRQCRKDGSVRDVRVTSQVVWVGGRELLLATWRDVTQRRHREQQNRNQSFVLENVRQGVLYTDQRAIIRFCNTAFEAMFGYGRGELIGKHVSVLNAMAPGENERFVAEVVGALETVGSWRGEVRNRRKDGSVFATRATVTGLPIQGEVCWVTIQEDITEERRLTARLREHELLLDLFFDASPSGMALFDGRLRCLRINSTLSALLGLSEEALQGRRLADFGPELGRVVESRLAEVLKEGRPLQGFEFQAGGSAARPRDWTASFFPVYDAEGAIWGGGCVVTEVTEQRRSEQALRLLSGRLLRVQDEERRRLARELHDTTVQNLAVLCMDLSLLETHLGAEQLGARSLLKASSMLAGQCVAEIRSFSYLLHPPLLEELGLTGALSDFAAGFSKRTGIRVTLSIPKAMCRLSDEAELALFRVAQESLANVLRHSGSRSASLSLELVDGAAVLQVADQGCGCAVPDEGSLTEGGAAVVGVGIAGMRERIRQLGGRFEMESGASGMTVRAIVPWKKENAAP